MARSATMNTLFVVCVAAFAMTALPSSVNGRRAAAARHGLQRAGKDGDGVTNGTYFSGVHSSNAVLQRAPAVSALNGYVLGATSASTVEIHAVNLVDGGEYSASAVIVSYNAVEQNATWKVMLKQASAGGNWSFSASCGNCANSTASTISNVVFGDVWFCSGQSNMWLPMQYTVTRNRTFTILDNSQRYSNIRIQVQPNTVASDGFEAWTMPADANRWVVPDSTSLNGFSATCWYFAQELTDSWYFNNETIVPLGLIESAWGGTQIEVWQPNSTISSCTNASGGTIVNRAQGNGALFNGMVAPYVNTTIYGALWYQGENNVYECMCANGTTGRSCGDGGPYACGNVMHSRGYSCQMVNLINQWRSYWSVETGTTSASFPFGLVSLAAGTDEGHGANMANFRLSQTANYFVAPNPSMENTFVVMAHDAGDPWSPGDWRSGPAASRDWEADRPYQAIPDLRPMYRGNGVQDTTNYYMGPIHPRVKQTVGRRLATAARAIAYGHESEVWTGPVFAGCTVAAARSAFDITIQFNSTLLLDDTVHVWNPTSTAQQFQCAAVVDCLNGTDLSFRSDGACSMVSQLLAPPVSPLEVELNSTVWVPVPLNPNGHGTGSSIQVSAPSILKNGQSVVVTGLRYAWSSAPCCPGTDRSSLPCPPNSCPIQTFNTTLPAVPFTVGVSSGKCTCFAPQQC